MRPKTLTFILGTRPEAVKLCPLVLAVQAETALRARVCVTAQHRQLLDQALETFGVAADADLDLMQPGQTLPSLTARAVEAIDRYLADEPTDMVFVQGDTTTVFCAALAAYYRQIPIAHVEAGLRTGNKYAPFPEEMNRNLTSRLADLHFAPTQRAKANLLAEGVRADAIHVTGNTVVDALGIAIERLRREPQVVAGLPSFLQPSSADAEPPMVLITAHRRESFGQGLENICLAVAGLAQKFPNVHFVWPVHRNPEVGRTVRRILGEPSKGGCGEKGNLHLLEPQGYLPFLALMRRSTFLLTDSGGIQEEAPSLSKPVLVIRDVTDRPEAVEVGAARLVGTDRDTIVAGASLLLTDRAAYNRMAGVQNPYGDGHACRRILAAAAGFLAEGGNSGQHSAASDQSKVCR